MNYLCLLIEHSENRKLLAEFLRDYYYYQIFIPPTISDLDVYFDLCIVDDLMLCNYSTQIKQRVEQDSPIFLPILLVTRKEKLPENTMILGELVDEILTIPIDKRELWLRVANLLRLRHSSLEKNELIEMLYSDREELKIINRQLAQKNQDKTHQLAETRSRFERILVSSNTDHVTGLVNRYTWRDVWEREWQQSLQNCHPMSVILIDIDNFKLYHETAGTVQSNVGLKQVAQAIQQRLKRPQDLVARYEKAKFIVILPNMEQSEAMTVAENIRTDVENLKLIYEASLISEYLTVSLGIATVIPTVDLTPDTLIIQADEALYLAKEAGRNCVRCFNLN